MKWLRVRSTNGSESATSYTGLSAAFIYRAIQQSELVASRVGRGRSVVVSTDELDAWLVRRQRPDHATGTCIEETQR